MMRRNVFVVAAKRTAFGAFGGSFKNMTATDLGVVAAQGALEQIGGKADIVDSVFFG